MDEYGERDTGMTAQSRNPAADQSTRARDSRWPVWLWIVVLSFALYVVIFVLPAVGLLVWIYFDEILSFIKWFFWGTLLITVGLLLLAASGLMWLRKRGAATNMRSSTPFEVIIGTLGMLLVAWGALVASIDPTTAEEKTNVAQIAVAITGGTVIAIGSWVGWQTLQVNRDRLAHDRESTDARLDLDRTVSLTQNFTAAVEQLGATHSNGSPNFEVRLGGIYALERIAKNWAQRGEANDYWAVIEVLTAYLRHNTGRESDANGEDDSPGLPPDVEAIVEVLRRREGQRLEARENFQLNLREVCLPSVYLNHAPLSDAIFNGAILDDAYLIGADLQRSYLNGTSLNGAHLKDAHLERAYLNQAQLVKADLQGAQLQHADIRGEHLPREDLVSQENVTANLDSARLTGADLRCAHLEGGNFSNADMANAVLRRSHLTRANLYRTILRNSDIRGAHLEDTYLQNAVLDDADLRCVHLDAAYLILASFDSADLRGAHLKGATASHMRLDGQSVTHNQLIQRAIPPDHFGLSVVEGSTASFSGANLALVDLRQTYGLTIDALLEAKNVDPDLVPEHLREEFRRRNGLAGGGSGEGADETS